MTVVNNTTFKLPSGRKEPDGGLFVCTTRKSPKYPQMILEVGYSQSEASLVEDARHWLLGSSLQVQSVLIVKFVKPKGEDMHSADKWKAWVEVWVRTENDRQVSSDFSRALREQ